MKCIKCGRSLYAHNTKTKDNKTTRIYACRSCHSVYETEEYLMLQTETNINESPAKFKIECETCIHKEVCNFKNSYRTAFNAVIDLNSDSPARATITCTKWLPETCPDSVPTFLKKEMNIPGNQFLLLENNSDDFEQADILMRNYGYSLTQGYYHYIIPANNSVSLLDNLFVDCGTIWVNELKRENIGDHLLTNPIFHSCPTDTCVLVVNPNKKEIYNLRRINDDRIKD